MIEFVLYAILLGIMLSLILIGPSFFLLIETSLTKGWRSALALDAGVILADIVCIVFAYYGAKDLSIFIETHPGLYKIGGFLIMIYGGYMYFSKPVLHVDKSHVVSHNYFKTFANGFLMNLLNIGIVIFWFIIVGWVTIKYPKDYEFLLFIGIALLTFLGIDLAKIFLANKFKERMSDALVYKIRRVLGIALLIFGLVILLKGFFSFDRLENVIPNTPFHTDSLIQ
ncbi:LysE family transporter [Flavobacteriaceae bacterium Ap0902]|nr:LysE family transporter [Flavobacteriaceae bacterium Ap0902]